jgi:hypothetical protein
MVMIKKANEKILKRWARSLGFDAYGTFFFVQLANGTYHIRKCNSGSFCGRDLFEMRVVKKSALWVTQHRDEICKHCLIYLDAALKEMNEVKA